MRKQRDPYFDIIRGIAIIFVIGIHTFPAVPSIAEITLRQVIQCAVPLFIAISGYFIGKKSLSTKKTYLSFLKKQLPRVYFPMLLWSLPWLALAVHGGGHPLKNIAFTLIGGMSIFYFIPLIMQYYMLTPVMQWTVSRHFYIGGYFRIADICSSRSFRICAACVVSQFVYGILRQPIPSLVSLLLYRSGSRIGQTAQG